MSDFEARFHRPVAWAILSMAIIFLLIGVGVGIGLNVGKTNETDILKLRTSISAANMPIFASTALTTPTVAATVSLQGDYWGIFRRSADIAVIHSKASLLYCNTYSITGPVV